MSRRLITPIALPSLGFAPSPEPVTSRAPRRASARPLLPRGAYAHPYANDRVWIRRINHKGRIAAAEVLATLGWTVGSRLECRILAGTDSGPS